MTIVSKADLEQKLQYLKDNCKHPSLGLFGPGSMYWRMGKESILFLGSGYALLMQEAHPWVSTGAHYHSKVRKDPFGRWKRTFEAVNSMIFGDLDTALSYAKRVHAVHSKVKGKLDSGEDYAANNQKALFWVAATLAYTTVSMYEITEILSMEEKEKFYGEFKLFCFLFGIDEEVIPPDWNSFMDYYFLETTKLEVTPYAKEMIQHFINSFSSPFLYIPKKLFLDITAYMLPHNIAKQYGIELNKKQELFYDFFYFGIEKLYNKLHPKSRINPYYIKYVTLRK